MHFFLVGFHFSIFWVFTDIRGIGASRSSNSQASVTAGTQRRRRLFTEKVLIPWKNTMVNAIINHHSVCLSLQSFFCKRFMVRIASQDGVFGPPRYFKWKDLGSSHRGYPGVPRRIAQNSNLGLPTGTTLRQTFTYRTENHDVFHGKTPWENSTNFRVVHFQWLV